MCLIAFAWGASERYPFVVVANRDEFFDRPTAPLTQWTSTGGVSLVSGRDLRDGGTWTGFSAEGRFALLTNVRRPSAVAPASPVSRGHLVLDWLESQQSAIDWVQRLEPQRYQGFNMIVGDWPNQNCSFVTNQAEGTMEARPLPLGFVYGLSNASLDTPWPKTRLLKQALAQTLSENLNIEQLTARSLQSLLLPAPFDDDELPQTGVPYELEKALSSVFVRYPTGTEPKYGTRSSLVAAYEAGRGLHLTELTHRPDGASERSAPIALHWPQPR